jgi:hypothetical protein
MSGRWKKGQSGNPAGRPRKRRPHVSAFDVVFDKTLTVTQDGVARELGVDEVLELQTYQAALKGKRMAIRHVLKMIEKREAALAKSAPPPDRKPATWLWEGDPRNADAAMLLLGITVPDAQWEGRECEYGTRMKLSTWAAQAALSRPGRRQLGPKAMGDIRRVTLDPDKLRWPRGSRGE